MLGELHLHSSATLGMHITVSVLTGMSYNFTETLLFEIMNIIIRLNNSLQNICIGIALN